MIRASYSDKDLVVDILSQSFNDNKSVNYIVKQDDKREQRLRSLMQYAFDVCHAFGDVFLSDDKKGCALILLPDKKQLTFKSFIWNIELLVKCIGIANAKKAMRREAKIKKLQPKERVYYLWFIGVESHEQNKGIGTALLQGVIEKGELLNRVICLETSTLKNLPWYKKFGFRIYNELDLGYRLYFLKRG